MRGGVGCRRGGAGDMGGVHERALNVC
jgi:hypothetical protein